MPTTIIQGKRSSSESKPCVLVPTFNNARTLEKVLREAAAEGFPIVTVDDGSTDTTASILQNLLEAKIVTSNLRAPRNLGKAGALKLGFDHCATLGSLMPSQSIVTHNMTPQRFQTLPLPFNLTLICTFLGVASRYTVTSHDEIYLDAR